MGYYKIKDQWVHESYLRDIFLENEKYLRDEIDDLKIRLEQLEANNQAMRSFLAAKERVEKNNVPT